MAVKIEVNMTNKWLYSLIFLGTLLVLGVVVYAQSYGDIPNPWHGADTVKIIDSTNTEKTLQQAITDGTLVEKTWTTLEPPIDLGTLSDTYGTDSTKEFDLAIHIGTGLEIPAEAKEILVYAFITKGAISSSGCGSSNAICQRTFTIYTQEGTTKYAKKLTNIQYPNNAWTISSDNMWLPLTSEKKIHSHLELSILGNKDSNIQIIGYR